MSAPTRIAKILVSTVEPNGSLIEVSANQSELICLEKAFCFLFFEENRSRNVLGDFAGCDYFFIGGLGDRFVVRMQKLFLDA
jgi:hypothetical protein